MTGSTHPPKMTYANPSIHGGSDAVGGGGGEILGADAPCFDPIGALASASPRPRSGGVGTGSLPAPPDDRRSALSTARGPHSAPGGLLRRSRSREVRRNRPTLRPEMPACRVDSPGGSG